ncbi:sulfate adenylyltransferase subunit CysN [Duganella sp. Root198D2]|uniref:sulfate adenylyltransferase subunit CysN n=1 Tax=Duganella sp. Root198D2 TaxID=1736489 RepID=UPI00070CE57E|nr:sulfate adenylyltransferase subunit CysN [Duganella sp. Root198D2]KRB83405.1 adenylyltransferase [Duganella sp. Root198D2]
MQRSSSRTPAHAPRLPVAAPLTTLETLQRQQDGQDLLRVITCGSVDDGKSTLIGRLLWESQQLLDDQLASLEKESKKYGTQGEQIDFALLVDGLAAEREQGITIDIAYRFFGTSQRRFIIADTPGHQQYTRNMVTAASTADVAVLLIDARHGLQTQTRRHAFLASLMGVRHVVLAINKMDLVAYAQAVFTQIREDFNAFAANFSLSSVTAIPLSALQGDNLAERSLNMPWYAGPTMLGYLETVKLEAPWGQQAVFPVQWVNRPDSTFRGFSGTMAQGSLNVGDEIRVTASGQTSKIAEILTMDGALQLASRGDAVTLRLATEIDASRGDILSLAKAPLDMTDQMEATLIWTDSDPGLVGRNYHIKLATQDASASITKIKHEVDVNTLAHKACKQLELNSISNCTLALSKPLVFDNYEKSKPLGSFILIDRFSNATVAIGMVRHSLRRAQNVHKQALSINREAREKLNGHRGKVIWLTGLSGSGKSTIANALEIALHTDGKRTYVLDGDNVRQGLNRDLGFTDADRVENIRRVAEVAKLMLDAGMIVITAFISPFRREREMARELIGSDNFVEVYLNTPLEVCEGRDPKGLYKKARAGQLPNLSGLGSPYEEPLAPGVIIDSAKHSIEDCVALVLKEGMA